MAPPLGRLAASRSHGTNRTGPRLSLSAAPQTLTEKLAQELGPHHGQSGHGRDGDMSASSTSFATNSPHASGPHGFCGAADEYGEERMPIPLAWRDPTAPAPAGWLVRQLRAGLLGLVMGLAAVIPTVLWLTDHLGGVADFQSISTGSNVSGVSGGGPALATGESAPVLVVAPQPAERPVVPESDSETGSAEELLSRAHGYIAEGNMIRAREILSEAVLSDNPAATFALAETYDPNILAATGAKGARAEVERARMLYGKALAGGVAAARKRLDGLK